MTKQLQLAALFSTAILGKHSYLIEASSLTAF
jgi:hypothetical protein